MQLSLVMWLIAALPIILLLFLMSYVNIESKKAALISLAITTFFATFIYELQFHQLIISIQKGAALSLYVILIIIGAVLLYNIVDTSGGFETIKDFMKSIEGNKSLQFIGLTWAFSGFIQGVTGFGVPIAIVGALLIGIGYKPLKTISAVLIGHSWAVSFGSMGSSFFALQLVTNLEPRSLGIILALFFIFPIFITGISVAHVYGGMREVKNNFKHILLMSIIMWLGLVSASYLNIPHIGSLLAGTIGSFYFITVIILKSKLPIKDILKYKNEIMSIKSALFPYIVLIISVLIFQTPLVQNIIPDFKMNFSFPEFTTGLGYYIEAEESFSPIGLFSHPLFFLIISSLSGLILYRTKSYLKSDNIKSIVQNTYKKSISSATTVLLLMIMALIMNNSGMIFNFAQGMAYLGRYTFPIISPLIGILGAFLTGSNTSSNVLFGAFQINTAELLNFSPEIIASTQSIGGSIGSAIAPAKILLGTSVVGLTNKEGDIIINNLKYVLIIGIIVGLSSLFTLLII